MMKLENKEAEKSVLGALLLEGQLMKECRLSEVHFSDPVHRGIFRLLRQLEDDGKPIDLVALVSVMDPSFLEQIGGLSYLTHLAESVPTTANFGHYERILQGGWKMNQAMLAAQQMQEKLVTERDEGAIGEMITTLCELEEAEYEDDEAIATTVTALFQKFQEDKGDLTGIDTGFWALNRMTCGLQEGDLVIIGARPSMGKTAFALNLALHAAKTGAGVGIFSLEMSKEQLVKRLMSCVQNIEGDKLKNPRRRFAIPDWDKMIDASADLTGLPIAIFEKAGVQLQQMWVQVRKLKRRYPDQKILVIVDYLQLIAGDAKHKGNRFQEISEISRKLKLMARDLNVCVVALSQLSRAVEARQDKRPLLSDLRESGQIEQDADLIMLMYREDYYENDGDGVVELNIAKHRNGSVGKIRVRFLKECGRFVSY